MNKVYLVGAGPGDPELLTLKGRRLLAQAGAVLYDHLANEALLKIAPPDAERLYVGKKKDEHSHTQEEIVATMIDRARRGLTVVRLKGGDPFIFGRGGEEVEALAEAGIPFEVVPGVTAPLGIAAYSGVPLTHRDHTSVVTFVTGHSVQNIDWERIGAAETLVIFMGVTAIRDISARILAGGRPPDTPAIAVRWGTRPDQRTVIGTLATLPDLIERQGLKPPATVIIGDVVSLRERLNWFERLPLFGKRIVVTRAQEQAGELAATLHELGAHVLEFAAIEIQPAADYGPLDRALRCLGSYDWLVFTSVNGVRFFLERLDRSAVDLRSLRARLCAIGPATRRAVEALHLKVDLMPEEYVAESLVEAFSAHDLNGKRVLLPRAAVARDVLPEELRRRGAHVDVVEAYHTALPDSARANAAEILSQNPDWITFTSSSTVTNFVEAAGGPALRGARLASIGPVTSNTARKLGLRVDVEANPHTIDGLISAILAASHQI